MSEEDFNSTYDELVNLTADLEIGKANMNHLELIRKRIVILNNMIDDMYRSELEEEHEIVEMCYQYYRLKDRYFSNV